MAQRSESSSASWLTAALYAAGLGTTLMLAVALHGFYHDDAYISLRYAANLLHGHGLVWNEGERVEGYTNFLHVMLVAGLGSLGVDLVAASRLIGIASYAALLVLLAWYLQLPRFIRTRDGSVQHMNAALAFLLSASAVPLVAWAFGGLETVTVALWVAAGCIATLKLLDGAPSAATARIAGAAFALAMLTRPDTMLPAAISLAFVALCARRDRAFWPPLLWMAAVMLAVQLPYQLWRVTYFGDWLPNTYYAKVYGIPREWLVVGGAFYLLQYWLMFPLLPLVIGVLAVLMLSRRLLGIGEAYLLALLYGGMIAAAWVGGDHMPYMRMTAVFAPMAALLLHRLCGRLIAGGKAQWVRDLAAAMLLFIPAQGGYAQEAGLSSGALSGVLVADFVQKHFPAGSLIAVNPAGALPYLTPQHRYIDMLGLNDRTIAHRAISELRADGQRAVGHLKGDGAYVLSRKPDYIIMGMNWGAPADAPMFLSDVELVENPAFKARYVPVTAQVEIPERYRQAVQALSPEFAKQYHLQLADGKLRFVYFKRRS